MKRISFIPEKTYFGKSGKENYDMLQIGQGRSSLNGSPLVLMTKVYIGKEQKAKVNWMFSEDGLIEQFLAEPLDGRYNKTLLADVPASADPQGFRYGSTNPFSKELSFLLEYMNETDKAKVFEEWFGKGHRKVQKLILNNQRGELYGVEKIKDGHRPLPEIVHNRIAWDILRQASGWKEYVEEHGPKSIKISCKPVY